MINTANVNGKINGDRLIIIANAAQINMVTYATARIGTGDEMNLTIENWSSVAW